MRSTPAGEGGASTARGCPFQETIQQLALYIRYFGQEYLPILPSAPGSPDVFSRQGDALRAAFRGLDANVTGFLSDCRRMAENGTGVEAEGETRRHHVAHARTIESDAAAFFRSVEKLCDSLSGETPVPGETIAELEDFTSEAVAFLDIPETSSQENRRADRY